LHLITPADAAAIAKGKTRELDEVRIGEFVYTNVSITWPVMTASTKSPVAIDLRLRTVHREISDPETTAAVVTLSVLGGIGTLVGLTFGLMKVFENYSFTNVSN
jgi:hypothetical protein